MQEHFLALCLEDEAFRMLRYTRDDRAATFG